MFIHHDPCVHVLLPLQHMSSVSAVTQDISFTAKVASFTPLNNDLLIKQFAAWLQERSTEQNFIVWRCTLEGSSQDYNT